MKSSKENTTSAKDTHPKSLASDSEGLALEAPLSSFSIQAKLLIGQPNDPFEQEADRMAEKVVDGISTSSSQHKIPDIQRFAPSGGLPAPDNIHQQLQANAGRGQALPEKTQGEMEAVFGRDFSEVNIHTNEQAVQMNREIGAQAFTHGQDIYFNSGKYQPESEDGKRLLAHELTHVVQQGGDGPSFDINKQLIQRSGGSDLLNDFFNDPPTAKARVDINMGLIVKLFNPDSKWVAGASKEVQALAIAMKAIIDSQGGKKYEASLVQPTFEHLQQNIQSFRGTGELKGKARQKDDGIREFSVDGVIAVELINYLKEKGYNIKLSDDEIQILTLNIDLSLAFNIIQQIGDKPLPKWFNLNFFRTLLKNFKNEVTIFQFQLKLFRSKETPERENKVIEEALSLRKALAPIVNLIEAIRKDERLTDHDMYRALWNIPLKGADEDDVIPIVDEKTQLNNHSAGILVQQAHTSYSIAAKARKDSDEGYKNRVYLLDVALKLARRDGFLKKNEGSATLRNSPNRINAPAWPSKLLSYPALSPPFFDRATGASHSFEMVITYPDVIDALAGRFHNRFQWDLIKVDEDKILELQGIAEDYSRRGANPGWGRVIGQRLERQYDYWQADKKKAEAIEGLTHFIGAPGGGLDFITINRLISSIGSVIKSVIQMITEPESERTFPIDSPGLYIVRCIVSMGGDPDGDATYVRAPSMAYVPIWARPVREMAEIREEFAFQRGKGAEERMEEIKELLKDNTLKPEERQRLVAEMANINININGSLSEVLENEKKQLTQRLHELLGQPESKTQEDEDFINFQTDQIDKRVAEIDEILKTHQGRLEKYKAEPGQNLEKPIRLPAVFVNDDGHPINLAIELIQTGGKKIGETNWYKYYVSDLTTKDSKDKEGPWSASRVEAITKVVDAHLESPNRYGRGVCTIRIPPQEGSGLTQSVVKTIKIDADLKAIGLESITNITTVFQIAAVAAAPFTGGASLAIMVPVGIVGSIPSAYRLLDNYTSGTFRMDLSSAIDMVDLVGSLIGVGKGARLLKPMIVQRGLIMMGLGADGLSFGLAGAQFLEQIKNIDPTLSPGAKRALIMELVGQQLMSLGIQLGSSLYRKGRKTYQEETGIQSLATLDRAPQELHTVLHQQKIHDIPIYNDPKLTGNTVEVHYKVDGYGLVIDVHLKVGKTARKVDIEAHVATIQTLKKFSGVQGLLRNIIDRITTLVHGSRKFKKDTIAWEAKLELEKLPPLIKRTQQQIIDGKISARDGEAFILNIEKQISEHANKLNDFSPGTGKIAAQSKISVESEAISNGYPKSPPGHYYIKTDTGDFQLRRYLGSDKTPLEVVPKSNGEGYRFKEIPQDTGESTPSTPLPKDKADPFDVEKSDPPSNSDNTRRGELLEKQTSLIDQRTDTEGRRSQLHQKIVQIDALLQERSRIHQEGTSEAGNARMKEILREIQQLVGDEFEIKRIEDALEARKELSLERGVLDQGLQEIGRKMAWLDQALNPEQYRALLPCFTADTPVWTPTGTRTIDTLEAGEMVLTYDLDALQIVPKKIEILHRNRSEHYYEIHVKNQTIKATGQHPFYLPLTDEWTVASELITGQKLLTLQGTMQEVQGVERVEVPIYETYNLRIADNHNYFVGPGVLVHNGGATLRSDGSIDLGLGGSQVVYRGTNPDYPGKIYIGRTDRPVSVRQGEERAQAEAFIQLHDQLLEMVRREGRGFSEGKNQLFQDLLQAVGRTPRRYTPSELSGLQNVDRPFFEFARGVQLEVVVQGMTTVEQARYIEQINIDLELRLHDPGALEGGVTTSDVVMNRRNEANRSFDTLEEAVRQQLAGTEFCP